MAALREIQRIPGNNYILEAISLKILATSSRCAFRVLISQDKSFIISLSDSVIFSPAYDHIPGKTTQYQNQQNTHAYRGTDIYKHSHNYGSHTTCTSEPLLQLPVMLCHVTVA